MKRLVLIVALVLVGWLWWESRRRGPLIPDADVPPGQSPSITPPNYYGWRREPKSAGELRADATRRLVKMLSRPITVPGWSDFDFFGGSVPPQLRAL